MKGRNQGNEKDRTREARLKVKKRPEFDSRNGVNETKVERPKEKKSEQVLLVVRTNPLFGLGQISSVSHLTIFLQMI